MTTLIVPVLIALFQGLRSLGNGQGLPAGTKTVTLNVAALLAWAVARWGLPVPPEFIDPLAIVLITGGNLIVRALTKGPLPGTDTD